MRNKNNRWEVLTVILATLLVLLIGGNDIALAQSAAINSATMSATGISLFMGILPLFSAPGRW